MQADVLVSLIPHNSRFLLLTAEATAEKELGRYWAWLPAHGGVGPQEPAGPCVADIRPQISASTLKIEFPIISLLSMHIPMET